MPLAARSNFKLTFIDAGGELSSVSFTGSQIGANVDMTTFDTETDAIQTAVEAVVLGNVAGVRKAPFIEEVVSVFAASSYNAQREDKWLVTYQDDVTGDRYTCSIPCANIDGVYFDHASEYLILTDAAAIAFVTAFEAIATAPKTQNAVSVISVKYVGRNL